MAEANKNTGRRSGTGGRSERRGIMDGKVRATKQKGAERGVIRDEKLPWEERGEEEGR